jgi:hypothetical protein
MSDRKVTVQRIAVPCCEIRTVAPLTSIVAARVPLSRFPDTVYVIVPLPEPDAADVNDTHAAFDTAVHAQFEVIATVPLPPPEL